MNTVRFVDLARQYAGIKREVDDCLLRAVASTQYVLGEEVALFEQEWAAYCEARHSVGIASGTAALHLALEALGVGPGDEVIAPANTFIASILPVLKLGARPVLVDCDAHSGNIDVDRVEAVMNKRTKALLAVHLYGQPADLAPLAELCERRGIALVEDACQAHGARYRGRRAGSFGRIAAFSFYPGKNLGAYGDAGAVTTNDDELAHRIRLLRNLGQEPKYNHVVLGWNERLDTLQAAVLRVKLRHLDEWNDLRRSHADSYAAALGSADVRLPQVQEGREHVWHLYVIRTEERDRLAAELAGLGIETGLHYPTPLHLQPALRAELGYAKGAFPVAEEWARTLLSLPMFPELEPEEIDRVGRGVREFSSSRLALPAPS